MTSGIRDGLALLSACWLGMTVFVIHGGDSARLFEDRTQALATTAAVAYLIAFGIWKIVRR